MEIRGIEKGLIRTALAELIKICAGLPGNPSPEKQSGYITVLNGITGEIVFTMPIGNIPADKKEKYLLLSQEKAQRLFNSESHDLTSWQSRDPDRNQWGGAITVQSYIFSFSGLPELFDEALMLVLARKLGWLDAKSASALASISDNSFYQLLLRRAKK